MKDKKLYLLKEMNTLQVQEALQAKVPLFLPLGTLEAHGRHLPISTDTLCAEEIAKSLSRKVGGVVAPSLEYGLTNVLLQTSPASFFDVELYKDFVATIIRNFRKQGFKTIIVINGHGGNRDALKPIIRTITREESLALAIINWWAYSERFVKEIYNCEPGGHAAVEETAAILSFFPELVTKGNYESSIDDHVPDESIWMYPPPGEVLLNKEGEGQPCFDKKKADKFIAKTVSSLAQQIEKWLNSFNHIKGGLRPQWKQ